MNRDEEKGETEGQKQAIEGDNANAHTDTTSFQNVLNNKLNPPVRWKTLHRSTDGADVNGNLHLAPRAATIQKSFCLKGLVSRSHHLSSFLVVAMAIYEFKFTVVI